MRRRQILRLAAASGAWLALAAHTPYRQWEVYRKRHLLILTHRGDPRTYEIGARVAAVLAKHLPASQAQVTRAPHGERIASLISTKQMDVAVLSRADAVALRFGRAPFADYGTMELRRLVVLGDYLLVCRRDFPARHAYQVVKTLAGHRAELAAKLAPGAKGGAVPLHRGARAFFEGRPAPALAE